MLYVLRGELLVHCSAPSGPALEGLQNLLLAIRQGLHAVSGPPEIFSALAANQNLSARERATATKLANRRVDLQSIEKRIRQKVFVANVAIAPLVRIDDFSWEIGVENLRPSWLGIAALLAENAVDAELYGRAARHYQLQNGLKGVVSRYVARGGGGSQIDVEFRQLLRGGVPVLAVTDGDLKHPVGEGSVISKRCDAAVQATEGLGWHIALGAREIENIVPHAVLFEVADPENRSAVLQTIDELFKSGASVDRAPCMFTCLKAGKKLCEVFRSDENEKRYWLPVIRQMEKQRPQFDAECLEDSQCHQDPCTCIVNLGFGEGVLQQVKKWMDERSPHEALRTFSKSALWMEIGRIVFDTSVAFEIERI